MNDEGEFETKLGVDWRCDAQGNRRPESDWNHPVINVSWDDAMAFCEWKTRVTGKTYRLPTEAEWEYAARSGGKNYKFAWGDGSPNGNVIDASCLTKYPDWSDYVWPNGYRDGYIFSCPVENSGTNEWGLFGMTGNVWEWCSDWYGKDYYTNSPPTNPIGPETGTFRILRGGSWNTYPPYCQMANRSAGKPGYYHFTCGFRLASPQN